jgi:DNA-binding GntR family transcriptional regulator
MAGRLRPGAAINELDIAEQLGVSRTPLREALMLLENEGIVEPRRGFRMRETTARVIDVSVSQHEAIVEALDRGDVAAAAEAVEFNWRSGAVRLAAALSGEGQV